MLAILVVIRQGVDEGSRKCWSLPIFWTRLGGDGIKPGVTTQQEPWVAGSAQLPGPVSGDGITSAV